MGYNENKSVYDELASEYSKHADEYLQFQRHLSGIILSFLNDRTNKRRTTLELGCGSGSLTYAFLERKENMVAIDYSESMITHASRLCDPFCTGIFIHDDFLTHQFSTFQFDCILAQAFIHLFRRDELKAIINKIDTLLQPNGIFFIGTTVHSITTEGYKEKSNYEQQLKRFRIEWNIDDLTEFLSPQFKLLFRFDTFDARVKDKLWTNLFYIKNE